MRPRREWHVWEGELALPSPSHAHSTLKVVRGATSGGTPTLLLNASLVSMVMRAAREMSVLAGCMQGLTWKEEAHPPHTTSRTRYPAYRRDATLSTPCSICLAQAQARRQVSSTSGSLVKHSSLHTPLHHSSRACKRPPRARGLHKRRQPRGSRHKARTRL